MRGLFDSLVFAGFTRHRAGWAREVTRADLEHLGSHLKNLPPAKTVLVLGAGNVSSIPPTDAISKIFQEGHVVLLKMNPVNEYLGPIFQRLFARLIEQGFLRIIYGGADVGAAAVKHPQVDEVHITGSIYSHDAIVWGPAGPERERRKRDNDPVLNKPITSELGNVSPWIIVPGPYTEAQLKFQAENVAASIVNNASFNCVATKMIVTWKNWPQRQAVSRPGGRSARPRAAPQGVLSRAPPIGSQIHRASAAQRCRRRRCPGRSLRDADPEQTAGAVLRGVVRLRLRRDRLWTADNERDFLNRAVEFANDRLWGTLSAGVDRASELPQGPGRSRLLQHGADQLAARRRGHQSLAGAGLCDDEPALGRLSVGTLADAQSGIGSVHNTFMLEHVQKTVLEGPADDLAQAVLVSHAPRPEPIAWKVLALYHRPSAWKLPGLVLGSLKG